MIVNYRKMGNNGAEKERVLVNDTNGWLEMRNCNGSECRTLQTTYLYRERVSDQYFLGWFISLRDS